MQVQLNTLTSQSQPQTDSETGAKFWKLDGKLHREDGPAIEYADGQKEWYLEGNKVDVHQVADFLLRRVQENAAAVLAKAAKT